MLPCPHALAPAQLAQGLTHSLEEHQREDSQQQEQEQGQRLVHLSPGWRGDAERAGAGQQSARDELARLPWCAEGRGLESWAELFLGCGQSFLLHTCSGCFTATQAQEVFPQSQPPGYL